MGLHLPGPTNVQPRELFEHNVPYRRLGQEGADARSAGSREIRFEVGRGQYDYRCKLIVAVQARTQPLQKFKAADWGSFSFFPVGQGTP